MKGSLIIVGFFVLGALCGVYHLIPYDFTQSKLSFYALCALMFSVGVIVVFPASGCEIIAKVLRLLTSALISSMYSNLSAAAIQAERFYSTEYPAIFQPLLFRRLLPKESRRRIRLPLPQDTAPPY